MNAGSVNQTADLEGRSILITGSDGYIGSRLMEQLRTSAAEVVGVDKTSSTRPNELCIDLRDGEATQALMADQKPICIVHAGTHSALAYQNDFLNSFMDDSKALFNLLTALEELPHSRLVVFSSSYVYSGIEPDEIVTEQTGLRPSHNFGVAKAFFEQLVLRTHAQSVVFRLSSVYGLGKQLHPNALANMAHECIEQGLITVWGAGMRKMQYVHIDDVLEYTLEGFEIQPGVYNLGSDEYTSVADAATLIADSFGGAVEYLRDKKEGATLPFMDTAKLKQASVTEHDTPLSLGLPNYVRELTKGD